MLRHNTKCLLSSSARKSHWHWPKFGRHCFAHISILRENIVDDSFYKWNLVSAVEFKVKVGDMINVLSIFFCIFKAFSPRIYLRVRISEGRGLKRWQWGRIRVTIALWLWSITQSQGRRYDYCCINPFLWLSHSAHRFTTVSQITADEGGSNW